MNSRRPISRRTFLTATAATSFALTRSTRTHAATAGEYDLIDLSPLLPPGNSTAEVINNRQLVAGTCTSRKQPPITGFVWENGTAQTFSALTGTPERANWPFDVNDSNVIVGGPLPPSQAGGVAPAFRITGSKLEPLPVIGDRTAMWAYAINQGGVIVGMANGPSTEPRANAVIWQDGAVSYLDAGDSVESVAFGINNAGVVVGYVWGDTDKEGAIWIDGALETLPHFSDDLPDDIATGINDARTVIGGSGKIVNSIPFVEPWLWTPGASSLTNLEIPQGTTYVSANAINESGAIVGSADMERGLLWRGGAMIDLDTLLPPSSGWHIIAANDINDRDDIAANAVHIDDPDTSRAVILTPHR